MFAHVCTITVRSAVQTLQLARPHHISEEERGQFDKKSGNVGHGDADDPGPAADGDLQHPTIEGPLR